MSAVSAGRLAYSNALACLEQRTAVPAGYPSRSRYSDHRRSARAGIYIALDTPPASGDNGLIKLPSTST